MKKSIFLVITFFVMYLILDYINIFQLIGLSFVRINANVLEIVVNALIVVGLYAITYLAIDRKQIEKEKNSKEMADLFLLNVYRSCYDSLSFICDSEFVKKYIVPKADFNKTNQDDDVIKNICNSPFCTNDCILRLAESGYIEKETLKKYLTIRSDFKHWSSTKITFYDLDGTGTVEQQKFYNNMQLNLKNLKDMLENEITRLSQ